MKTIVLRSLLLALFTISAWAQLPGQDITYDVRNGDQTGKLMIRDSELAFESLTDGKHSRTWKYPEIRSLEKKGKKDMRVKPYKGSTYDFQLKEQKMRDTIYNSISERLMAARSQGKK